MNRAKAVGEIRQKLRMGKPSIGTWMQLSDPSIAEILASADFDWVTLDLEHGSFSPHEMPNLFRAIEMHEKVGLARLAEGTMTECKRALDAGAGGLIIPMVNSREQMEQIIKHAAWPPAGERGVAFSRANMFGSKFEDYVEEAQRPLIVPMIETQLAVRNLKEILSVPGVDAVMIGPYDLSASLGVMGRFEDDVFKNEIDKIRAICKDSRIPCGIHVVQPDVDELNKRIVEGYQFIAYSIDSVVLARFVADHLKWSKAK